MASNTRFPLLVIEPTDVKFLLLKLILELPELIDRVLPPSLVIPPLNTADPCA